MVWSENKTKGKQAKTNDKLSLLYSSSFLLGFNHYLELHAYPSYECSFNFILEILLWFKCLSPQHPTHPASAVYVDPNLQSDGIRRRSLWEILISGRMELQRWD